MRSFFWSVFSRIRTEYREILHAVMGIPKLYYLELILFSTSNKAIFLDLNLSRTYFAISLKSAFYISFLPIFRYHWSKEVLRSSSLMCFILSKQALQYQLNAKIICNLISFEAVWVKCTWSKQQTIVYILSYMCLSIFFVALYLCLLTVELSFSKIVNTPK